MRVKCLAQEPNKMSPARTRKQTARSGVVRTNHEATAPPNSKNYELSKKNQDDVFLCTTYNGYDFKIFDKPVDEQIETK